MGPFLLLLLGLSTVVADVFKTTANFKVIKGKVQKPATCDVEIVYTGTEVNQAKTTVKCSVEWKKKWFLNFPKTLSYNIGNPEKDMFTLELKIKLFKKKNQHAETMVTKLLSMTPTFAIPEFSPRYLHCPENNFFIWRQRIVNETEVTGYDKCAQHCSEFTDSETGYKPCFAWTLNNNKKSTFGLAPGTCRLYGYMKVIGIPVVGVQSGYHKCWNAMQAQTTTSTAH